MSDVSAVIPELLRVLDLIGVLTNAVLGSMMARQHRLDPIGFGAMALVTGLGGGIIRDVLLQRGTPVALTDAAYLTTVLLGAAFAFVIPLDERVWRRVFPLIDALALGSWAASGTQKTLLFGLHWLAAMLLGTVTAVGGGAVRDVVLRRVPEIFGGNTLYATCALAASGLLVLLHGGGLSREAPLIATGVGAALYLLARWRRWTLPAELPRVRLRGGGGRSGKQGP